MFQYKIKHWFWLVVILSVFNRPILLVITNCFWIPDILHGLHVTLAPIFWLLRQDQLIVELDYNRSPAVMIGLICGSMVYVLLFVHVLFRLLMKVLP